MNGFENTTEMAKAIHFEQVCYQEFSVWGDIFSKPAEKTIKQIHEGERGSHRKIHRKRLVSESHFNKIADLRPVEFLFSKFCGPCLNSQKF